MHNKISLDGGTIKEGSEGAGGRAKWALQSIFQRALKFFKSLIHPQKSPIFPQKSLAFLRKTPIMLGERNGTESDGYGEEQRRNSLQIKFNLIYAAKTLKTFRITNQRDIFVFNQLCDAVFFIGKQSFSGSFAFFLSVLKTMARVVLPSRFCDTKSATHNAT